MGTIELLAPAKDANTAVTAIKCGADAVYMGASAFGARQGACNPIGDIQKVVDFAHPYYAKVYVTLNTLLYDDELPAAEKMINQLYKIGVDALIIQDVGLLELDLPPIPLVASTQMNNNTVEKVQFLEQVGFSRVILARELTLGQIRRIRKGTSLELECFIHGSLCVGASGQCFMSYCIGKRSANRGQCAQPCRRLYTLKDQIGHIIKKDRYLLSLKDLSLSDYIEQLINAGITAFKIEGRLKEIPYVANTVGYYREKFDAVLKKKALQKASSGKAYLNFRPDPQKTFNRGFTDYGISGRCDLLASLNTPKSIGEYVGVITKVEKNSFCIESDLQLNNADGICFFDKGQNLAGTVVNKVEGRRIWPQKMDCLKVNLKIYRNYNHKFSKMLEKKAAERKVLMSMVLSETENGFSLLGRDEDGNEAVFEMDVKKQPAIKKQNAQETIIAQLKKTGGTIFECGAVSLDLKQMYFLPVSVLNAAKRGLIQILIDVRQLNRPRRSGRILKNSVPYPEKQLTYLGNCLNKKAYDFYRRHGVETIEPAAETGLNMKGRLVMMTKYCLRRELGLCKGVPQRAFAEPLILEDEDGRKFRVEFRCEQCGMNIFC